MTDERLDVPATGRSAEDDGGPAAGGDDQTVTVWLYMGRGYKFSKHKEYGMQVGFTREPDEGTLELARAQMEGYMRAEGIRGEIVYEMMEAEYPASMIPDEAFDERPTATVDTGYDNPVGTDRGTTHDD